MYMGRMSEPCEQFALYPGLLTPASVTCSANAGEDLVKLITCNDVPGRVEEWHIPGKTGALLIANTDQKTTECLNQTVLVMFLGFRKLLYSCREGMCHSSTRPGISLHVISFTRPSVC